MPQTKYGILQSKYGAQSLSQIDQCTTEQDAAHLGNNRRKITLRHAARAIGSQKRGSRSQERGSPRNGQVIPGNSTKYGKKAMTRLRIPWPMSHTVHLVTTLFWCLRGRSVLASIPGAGGRKTWMRWAVCLTLNECHRNRSSIK